MRSKKEKVLSLEPKWYALEIIITVIIALIISLLLVLLLAFIIKTFNLPTEASSVITVIIKILSIFIASLICLKRPNSGWIRGAIVGIVYILISFLVFSILGEKFNFGLSLLNDVIIGMIAGVISGIVAVNVIRKN